MGKVKQTTIEWGLDRPTYKIAEDGKSITCHKCGRTSYNENDVKFLYCGYCRGFHTKTPGIIEQGGV